MQGRRMEVPFEGFYLPIWRFAAVNPGIENRRQRFAQLDNGCKYSLAIVRTDGAAKFSCLLRRQQAQLRREAEQIRVAGKQLPWICREAQVQGINELQGGVSSKQLKRLGNRTTHNDQYNS